jgi:hypothetical protein
MKSVLWLIFLSSLSVAENVERPVCNAKTRGQFWPAEANEDREAMHRFLQQGELELCTYGTFKYKWTRMSVNIHDLGKHEPDRSR